MLASAVSPGRPEGCRGSLGPGRHGRRPRAHPPPSRVSVWVSLPPSPPAAGSVPNGTVPAERSYQTSAGLRTCFLHLVSVLCSCAGVSGVRWPVRPSAIQPDPPPARPEGGGRGEAAPEAPCPPPALPAASPWTWPFPPCSHWRWSEGGLRTRLDGRPPSPGGRGHVGADRSGRVAGHGGSGQSAVSTLIYTPAPLTASRGRGLGAPPARPCAELGKIY